jgi:hypothetical protein
VYQTSLRETKCSITISLWGKSTNKRSDELNVNDKCGPILYIAIKNLGEDSFIQILPLEALNNINTESRVAKYIPFYADPTTEIRSFYSMF